MSKLKPLKLHYFASNLGTAPAQADMAAEIRDNFADGHGELVCMIVLGYPASIPVAPKRKEGKFVIR